MKLKIGEMLLKKQQNGMYYDIQSTEQYLFFISLL